MWLCVVGMVLVLTVNNSGSGAGISAMTSGAEGKAVSGFAGNSGGYYNYGGHFEARGTYGRGVYGTATGEWGTGVNGIASDNGTGVTYGGWFQAHSENSYGVYAKASGLDGRGVHGYASHTEGTSNRMRERWRAAITGWWEDSGRVSASALSTCRTWHSS